LVPSPVLGEVAALDESGRTTLSQPPHQHIKHRLLKAAVQMLIGAFAVILLGAKMWHGRAWWSPTFPSVQIGLTLIGAALAAATVVELAYTLFTDGPE
jgi:hypothetical protein